MTPSQKKSNERRKVKYRSKRISVAACEKVEKKARQQGLSGEMRKCPPNETEN